MGEQTDSSPTDSGPSEVKTSSSDDTIAGEILLEEARTTTSHQLGQIDKLDAAAVRTVRIAFLLVGILAGGSRLSSFPDLGTFGLLGTWSLVGSLLAGLIVYGTSQLFIGSSLDGLSIDHAGNPVSEHAYVKLINEYEDGMQTNRKVLHLNGFVLAIARSLLALTVLFVAIGFIHAVEIENWIPAVQTFMSLYRLS